MNEHRDSEAVDLDQILLGKVVACQEHRDVLALVPLQLNDLAQLSIVDHVAVAAEFCGQMDSLQHPDEMQQTTKQQTARCFKVRTRTEARQQFGYKMKAEASRTTRMKYLTDQACAHCLL